MPQTLKQTLEEIYPYLEAVFRGVWKEVKGTVVHTLEAVAHPIDNVIYPISALLYDASVIAALHTNPETLPAGAEYPHELAILRQAISANPQIYYDSVSSIKARIEHIKAAKKEYAEASGPKRWELNAGLVTDFTLIFVPGTTVKGINALKGLYRTHFPPKFFNNNLEDICLPLPPVKKLSFEEIRSTPGSKEYIWVYTTDKKLLICNDLYPTEISLRLFSEKKYQDIEEFINNGGIFVAHPELANLEPVYAAGTLRTKDGVIQLIENHSGHYLPKGDHLKDLTEKVFKKNGFFEADGKFEYLSGTKLAPPQNLQFPKKSTAVLGTLVSSKLIDDALRVNDLQRDENDFYSNSKYRFPIFHWANPDFTPSFYRGSATPFNSIFEKGFKAHGTNTDLFLHVNQLGKEQSIYISTSTSKEVAMGFPKPPPEDCNRTYLYEIHSSRTPINVEKAMPSILLQRRDLTTPDGIEKYLEDLKAYRAEYERAFKERIDAQEVKGCWEVDVQRKPVEFPKHFEVSPEILKDPFWQEYTRTLNPKFIPNPNYKAPLNAAQITWNSAKYAGRALTLVGAAQDSLSLYHEYQQSQITGDYQNTYREAARITGAWTTACAMGVGAAELGAICGAPFFGPVGSAIGGTVFGFVGSVAGYFIGSTAMGSTLPSSYEINFEFNHNQYSAEVIERPDITFLNISKKEDRTQTGPSGAKQTAASPHATQSYTEHQDLQRPQIWDKDLHAAIGSTREIQQAPAPYNPTAKGYTEHRDIKRPQIWESEFHSTAPPDVQQVPASHPATKGYTEHRDIPRPQIWNRELQATVGSPEAQQSPAPTSSPVTRGYTDLRDIQRPQFWGRELPTTVGSQETQKAPAAPPPPKVYTEHRDIQSPQIWDKDLQPSLGTREVRQTPPKPKPEHIFPGISNKEPVLFPSDKRNPTDGKTAFPPLNRGIGEIKLPSLSKGEAIICPPLKGPAITERILFPGLSTPPLETRTTRTVAPSTQIWGRALIQDPPKARQQQRAVATVTQTQEHHNSANQQARRRNEANNWFMSQWQHQQRQREEAWRKDRERSEAERRHRWQCDTEIGWKKSSIKSSILSSLKLGYSLEKAIFSSLLGVTGLVNSYNSYNFSGLYYDFARYAAEIGGVATEAGVISDLVNSKEHASANVYFLCLPFLRPELSQKLAQITHEFKEGCFTHRVAPFFSLHFNQNGFLYPVNDPFYRNTLIGEIISFLDYFLKGYLNGGVYNPEFLKTWHINENCDETYLRGQTIDLKEYCRRYAPELEYASLNEKENCMGIETKRRFKTTFRIIEYQRKIERAGNVLVAYPDYKVEHSIELSSGYKQHVETYIKEHGEPPPDYAQVKFCYSEFAKEVQQKMHQLPLCRDLFQLLGYVSSLSYFYNTLHKMGKRPVVQGNDFTPAYIPKAFPPIPVRYFRTFKFQITLKDILQQQLDLPRINQLLLLTFISPAEFITQSKFVFEKAIVAIITKSLRENFNLRDLDLVELNDTEVNTILNTTILGFLKIAQVNTVSIERIIAEYTMDWPDFQSSIQSLPLHEKLQATIKHINEYFNDLQNEWRRNLLSASLSKATWEYLWIRTRSALKTLLALKANTPDARTIADMINLFDAPYPNENKLKPERQEGHDGGVDYHLMLQIIANSPMALIMLSILQNFKLGKLDNCLKVVTSLSSILLSDKLPETVVSKQYTHSFLGFTGEALARETQDNFHIIGGCALQLPNLTTKTPVHAESLCQQIAEGFISDDQSSTEINYENEKYTVFRVPVYDVENQEYYESEESKQYKRNLSALGTLEDDSSPSISEAELAAPIQNDGTTVMYCAAGSLPAEQFDAVVKAAPRVLQLANKNGSLPIHAAVKEGNLAAVKIIAASDLYHLFIRNNSGLTPAMLATQYGREEIVAFLVRQGVNFNECLPNGLFPLYMATLKNYVDLAQWLVEHIPKLEINKTLDSNMTVLHLAIQIRATNLAIALIENGALCTIPRRGDGYTACHCAAEQGAVPILMKMEEKLIPLDQSLESGKTPLHLAAAAGQLEVVKLLVRLKANVNANTVHDETPLMLAIVNGHQEVALFLAEITALNVVNHFGETASSLSLQYAMPVVGDLLIRRGENPTIKDNKDLSYLYYLVRNGEYLRFKQISVHIRDFDQIFNGWSLLALAAQYGHFRIVYFLFIDKNAKFIALGSLKLLDYATIADEVGFLREYVTKDTDVATLAETAAKHGAVNSLKFLLKKLSSVQIQDSKLVVAAIISNSEDVIRTILKSCRDINKPLDRYGNTAIHLAVESGCFVAVDILVELGCRIDARNNSGKTPFHIAAAQNDGDGLTQLLQLTPVLDWPLDLWQEENYSLEIKKILTEHEKKFPKEIILASLRENSSAKRQKQLPRCPSLAEPDIDSINTFKTFISEKQFHKALTFVSENKTVQRVLCSQEGGKLLSHLFENIINPKNMEVLEHEKSEFERCVESLLDFIKSLGVSPLNFLGEENILLAMLKNNTVDGELDSCYRLKLYAKYFSETLPALAADTHSGMTFAQIIIKLKRLHFFELLDEICSQQQQNVYFGLHEAVASSDYRLTERLLQSERYDCNGLNVARVTPIMLAAQADSVAMVNLLLSHGALLDRIDLRGNTVLHHALGPHENKEVALALIPLIKRPNIPTRNGLTPLMIAAAFGKMPVVRYLCRTRHNIFAVDEKGQNALHHAAAKGQIDAISFLSQEGFNIDQVEKPHKEGDLDKCFHRTPLHLAALFGQDEAVIHLLHLGADPVKQDKQKASLCEYIVYSNQWYMIELVARYIPDYQSSSFNSRVVRACAQRDNIDVLSEFVANNEIDVNAVDEHTGQSALHISCCTNAGNVASLLLEGGDIVLDGHDRAGMAPIHYAAICGHVRLIQLLGAAHANLENSTSEGDHSLHLACKEGHLGAVTALLALNVNFLVINAQSLTGAQLALIHGHYAIAQVLESKGDPSLKHSAFTHLREEYRKQINDHLPYYTRFCKKETLTFSGLLTFGMHREVSKPFVETTPSTIPQLQIG